MATPQVGRPNQQTVAKKPYRRLGQHQIGQCWACTNEYVDKPQPLLKKEGNIMQIRLIHVLNPSSVGKIKVTNSKPLDDARLKQSLYRDSHAVEWWWRWTDQEQ